MDSNKPGSGHKFHLVSGSAAALAGLLLILAPFTAIADSYKAMERHAFEHEGVEREYFVHVPQNAAGPLPVVLALHGYSSTATGFQYAHDLNVHADQFGYIVVYPQATHFMAEVGSPTAYRATTWNSYGKDEPEPNAGPHCTAESYKYACPPGCGACHRCQWEPCTDDVAFIARVLDEVQADYATDVSRYYVLGVSSGGIMTIRIACDLSERFAAAAPIIGLQPPGHACGPEPGLPVLFLMGALDETIRLDGRAGKDDGFLYTTLDESTEVWAKSMQCKSGPLDWPNDLATAAGVECTAYSSCQIGCQEVVSCVDPNGMHLWPAQRPDALPATCVSPEQYDSMPGQTPCGPRPGDGEDAGMDLVWSFFSKYRRD